MYTVFMFQYASKALSARMDQNNNKKAGPLPTSPWWPWSSMHQYVTGNAERVYFPTAKTDCLSKLKIKIQPNAVYKKFSQNKVIKKD